MAAAALKRRGQLLLIYQGQAANETAFPTYTLAASGLARTARLPILDLGLAS